MKRLVLHLTNPTDRIEIPDGVTLRDVSDARNRPLAIGALVSVELLDDEADATGTPTPDPPTENVMRTLHIEPVSVRGHMEPGTPACWGALPLDEEPLDAA